MRLIRPLAKCLVRGMLPCGAALGPNSLPKALLEAQLRTAARSPGFTQCSFCKGRASELDLQKTGGTSTYRNVPFGRAAVGPHLCPCALSLKQVSSKAMGGTWVPHRKPSKSASSLPSSLPLLTELFRLFT